MDTIEARTERNARRGRASPTYVETALWKLLRHRRLEGLKFRRQVAIGRFVADFACYSARLIVEADGGVHRLRQQQDIERDIWLASQGFTVLRFPNERVVVTPHDVLSAIVAAARQSASR